MRKLTPPSAELSLPTAREIVNFSDFPGFKSDMTNIQTAAHAIVTVDDLNDVDIFNIPKDTTDEDLQYFCGDLMRRGMLQVANIHFGRSWQGNGASERTRDK